jgi:hypothetical protein
MVPLVLFNLDVGGSNIYGLMLCDTQLCSTRVSWIHPMRFEPWTIFCAATWDEKCNTEAETWRIKMLIGLFMKSFKPPQNKEQKMFNTYLGSNQTRVVANYPYHCIIPQVIKGFRQKASYLNMTTDRWNVVLCCDWYLLDCIFLGTIYLPVAISPRHFTCL